MKTIYKLLACAFLCILATASFAGTVTKPVNNGTVNPSEAPKDKSKDMVFKVFNNTNDIWIYVYVHYVGPSAGYGEYQLMTELVYNNEVANVPTGDSFTLSLNIQVFDNPPYVQNNVEFTTSGGSYQSNTQTLYFDHTPAVSDVVGYSQSATSFDGIPIVLYSSAYGTY
jgi:hypothetical protein